SASIVTATTATISGSISGSSCGAITSYGFEYSNTAGFANGTGTQITSSNLSGGNFSANLTGLTPNAKYYYKAFAVSGGNTSYGSQQTFTNTPLPVIMASQSGLSYLEDFHDIANWTDGFVSGVGANRFGGIDITVAAPATGIPDPTKITASSLVFASFSGSFPGTSGGVQRGTQQISPVPATESIVLLSTGSPDNTTSAAIDFYMDFTGVNAGTLSFDYQTLNNSTGDRNGSLRVYATTNGTSFTELTLANVLNFTNNVPVSGSKTNIDLPPSFNNSPTARLRFYYHNGSGGTGSGSRPKISIDNLNVTAVATIPCTTPTAQPTSMVFNSINDVSISGSFTAASPAPDQYLTIVSNNSSLTSNPVDGVTYSIGESLGDGAIIAKGNTLNFTASNLSPSTIYYFFTFATNGSCTGGPKYNTTNPLINSTSTTAGLPPCTAPISQASNLAFNNVTINSIKGSFSTTSADEYLVLKSTSSTVSATPVNGQVYNAGDILGNANVVQRSSNSTFTATGLATNTNYYFFIFSINSKNCTNGPVYKITNPLSGSQATMPLPACSTPTAQPTLLTLNASNNSISGAFNASNSADDYLIIRSTSSILSVTPTDNIDYTVGASLGGGVIIANNPATSFVTTNLNTSTNYYFFVFATNKNCSGGTKYLTSSPLTGNITTGNSLVNNYYFGSLHSHSAYSDGNKDHLNYIPADDYNYAMTSQCMDFLGISEHNHFSSPQNPGNIITTYHQGIIQADNFTSTHPNFLAMYGQEWGVISGGGHVVVYGDYGLNKDYLFGWESDVGGITGPNYDVYVPKNVYTGSTGLFKNINDSVARNTFATLAHPNLTDYNNLANVAYDISADSAITGTAVESGPATSTNTTYSNPGSSMYYLFYYQTLLAKGYHLGPTIDHDNHNTTFGHATYSRTAVIAPALTKTEIIKGMRNMHFYATQDCDTKVDFTINTKIMGSVFSDRNAPVISVSLSDATTSTSSAIIRVMFGIPGSGTFAVKIDSAIGSSLYSIDNNLANGATGYYYIDITNGASRIITAPIWYTRTDVATPYFRTRRSGNWNDVNTWETSSVADFSSGIISPATLIPDFNFNTITILNSHTVTITTNVTTDETVINPGGSLIINPGVILTINDGPGTDLTISSGASVTIRSTFAGTGSIGKSSGTISGNVTVERYISDRRAWRLLGVPFSSSSQTIKAAWMEGATSAAQNPFPGYGTHITTFVGDTMSYDAQKPASSIRYYTSNTFDADLGHTPNPFSPITGFRTYFLFVRGDRSIDLNNTSAHSATTLRITGTPTMGNVTKGVTGTSFSLISNPYPSVVNFDSIKAISTNSAINTFYVWDASLGTVGNYRTITVSGAAPSYTYIATPGSTDNNWRFIESGTAFMVPGNRTVDFTEGTKATGIPPSSMLRTSENETQLIINLNTVNPNNTVSPADGVREIFDNNYSSAVDNNDAKKIAGFELNLGIANNNEILAVEKRSLPNSNDIIYLKLTNMNLGNYQFEIQPYNFASQTPEAYLKDDYLKTSTPINLNVGTTVNFNITSDAASAAANRFSIVFIKQSSLVIAPSIVVYPNPVTNGNIQLQFNHMPVGIYSVRVLNNLGQMISSKKINNTLGTITENMQLNKIKGVYMIEITRPDNSKFTKKIIAD
ncbi:MAG: T9SS type A sorting domain-containing protein, partial [Bacteroidota bacterium]|nr:T9SS type A sorting domain-containing protein [Bacteroidota bacterium]